MFLTPDMNFGIGVNRSFHSFNVGILPILMLGLWLVIIVWVFRDAERRGMSGLLWALLVLVGNLIGLLIYLIVRSGNLPGQLEVKTSEPCANCGKNIAKKFVFCPYCGTRLKANCPSCEQPVSNDWRVCPQCGEKLVEEV